MGAAHWLAKKVCFRFVSGEDLESTKARSKIVLRSYLLTGCGFVLFLLGGGAIYMLAICAFVYAVVQVFRGS